MVLIQKKTAALRSYPSIIHAKTNVGGHKEQEITSIWEYAEQVVGRSLHVSSPNLEIPGLIDGRLIVINCII